MTVVGTVGHIDHGKTALLHALTGIDADRLPEERRRGITIDVGYAHLPLPNGESLDFVDLPGHHALADNFLVGAGEMDAALLVVAADSGPEAQTYEHLDVLAALALRRGVVALTKIDLVDERRRDALLADLAALLDASALDGATVVAVSARTGEGIPRLREALTALDMAVRSARGHDGGLLTRLAVDRAFRVAGHGLVATGSLRGGDLAVGAHLHVIPGGDSPVRVRRVQRHGKDVASAQPGTRVAVNVAGRHVGAIKRGAVLATGSGVVASDRLLVILDRSAATATRSRLTIAVHIGTDHAPGTVSLLNTRSTRLHRSPAAHAVLLLDRPVAAAIGDRFVVRLLSPARLLGGGTVADPAPPMMRTRMLRDRLQSVPAGSLLPTLLGYRGLMTLSEFERSAAALGTVTRPADAVPGATVIGALAVAPGAGDALIAEVADRVKVAGVGGVPASALRHGLAERIVRLGAVGREDANTAAGALVDQMAATGLLELRGELAVDARQPAAMRGLAHAEEALVRALDTSHPPALSDAARVASFPMEALSALFASGRLIRVADNVAFSAETYRTLERLALSMARRGDLTAAAFRDAAGTSRRHAVAVLDAMALAGVLRRVGNRHELGPRAPERLKTDERDAVAAHGGSS